MSQLTKISKTHSSLERIFNDEGFVDYKWITPEQIVVAQWVRMKCMFGFPNYGHKGTCPSQTPSVPASERFFNEYKNGVVFHFSLQNDKSEERIKWYRETATKLIELETKVFLAGFERAYMLLFGGCYLCVDCSGERSQCKLPEMARPAPEGLAVDVFSMVKNVGNQISVKKDLSQAADRFVMLMVD